MSLTQLIHALQLVQRSVAPDSPRVVFAAADGKEFDISETLEIGLSANKKEVAVILSQPKAKKAYSTNANIKNPKFY